MLQYLVPSKVRRRLLGLLWAEGKRGSVAKLAELADVSGASAHAELKAMRQVLLVESAQEDGKEVYYANVRHPDADTLRALVASDVGRTVALSSDEEMLKRKLKALGAPLRGVQALEVEPGDYLDTLLKGVALARRDPIVAKALPLCFWKLRESLEAKALLDVTTRAEEKHALAFFLELTSELGNDRRLLGLAEALRDGRMTSVRDFFQSHRRERVRPFPLAEKWGYQMNMDLETFRSLFDKYVT
jgi:DNA-binding transcriptional ArsR family regulator